MIGVLIEEGIKLVGIVAKLILEAGGTEEDLAKLKLENTNAINSTLAAAKEIKSEVEAEIATKPDG